ncbi:MAG: hypothetical protein LIQ31_02705 [Planctomycetes bacterium]|nr:hypothetical protein [Planctomycetota bacterium]
MTRWSLLLVLIVTGLLLAPVHGADIRIGQVSLPSFGQAFEYMHIPDTARPGAASLGKNTSLYVLNSAPISPAWSRTMGDAAGLYRVRVDDPRGYDPNSVYLGVDRWIGKSFLVQGVMNSNRGSEDMFQFRDQVKSVTQTAQVNAFYLPDNGFIVSGYASVSRVYDVPPGQETDSYSHRRFNTSEYRSLTGNAGLILGYGRRLFSTVSIQASTGLTSMWSNESYNLRVDDPLFNRLHNDSATAMTTIPLDLTVRYHTALSDQSRLLFEASVGMNHTLKVHDSISHTTMTATDASGGYAYSTSFDSMKNIVYVGAGIGYRRERVAAWLRYDQGRHGPLVTHRWTATLGWSF